MHKFKDPFLWEMHFFSKIGKYIMERLILFIYVKCVFSKSGKYIKSKTHFYMLLFFWFYFSVDFVMRCQFFSATFPPPGRFCDALSILWCCVIVVLSLSTINYCDAPVFFRVRGVITARILQNIHWNFTQNI